VADNLNRSDQKRLFDNVIIKLLSAIVSGAITGVHVSENGLVTKRTLVIELDDGEGTTKEVSASIPGAIANMFIENGKIVWEGDVLSKIIKTKRVYG